LAFSKETFEELETRLWENGINGESATML